MATFWGSPIVLDVVQTDPYDSDISTEQTIRRMVQLVDESCTKPEIASLVDGLLQRVPANSNQATYIREAFWWIKSHVTFGEDEDTLGQHLGFEDTNQELLIAPWVLVNMPKPMGDCDDFSMLMATLCKMVGIRVGFVTVAVDKEEPFRFSHVYCRAIVDGQVMNLDASHGKFPGWETSNIKYREVVWEI